MDVHLEVCLGDTYKIDCPKPIEAFNEAMNLHNGSMVDSPVDLIIKFKNHILRLNANGRFEII